LDEEKQKVVKKWLSKWDIKLHECPSTNEEIKKFVMEKFRMPCGLITMDIKKHTTSKNSIQL